MAYKLLLVQKGVTMNATQLFAIDPAAAVSYAQYNTVKEGKGSFEDFLLHYDSHEANEGGSNWLDRLIQNEGGFNTLAKHPELVNSLRGRDFNFLKGFSTSDFFGAKIESLKMMALLGVSPKK